MRTSAATNLVLQAEGLIHSKPMVARPQVIVKFIVVLACLDVICHSACPRFYLPLEVLSEPWAVDIVREL